jgi:hypothetical protein
MVAESPDRYSARRLLGPSSAGAPSSPHMSVTHCTPDRAIGRFWRAGYCGGDCGDREDSLSQEPMPELPDRPCAVTPGAHCLREVLVPVEPKTSTRPQAKHVEAAQRPAPTRSTRPHQIPSHSTGSVPRVHCLHLPDAGAQTESGLTACGHSTRPMPTSASWCSRHTRGMTTASCPEREVDERPAQAPTRIQGSNRYPTPGSVIRCRGCAGSGSNFRRNCARYTRR